MDDLEWVSTAYEIILGCYLVVLVGGFVSLRSERYKRER